MFHAVVGVLLDDTDPMVSVMKLEKAPQESYADIGGLHQQIQEIKVRYIASYSTVHGQVKLSHRLPVGDPQALKLSSGVFGQNFTGSFLTRVRLSVVFISKCSSQAS